MEKRYCKLCGKELAEKQIKTNKNFCSRSCAMTARYQDPKLREKISSAVKASLNKPEVKEKFKAKMKEVQNRPEIKQRKSESIKKTWENKEIRKKRCDRLKKAMSTEEAKHNKSCATKLNWQKEGYREHMQQVICDRWKDEDFKKKVSDNLKQILNNPEVKLKQSLSIKKALSNPEVKQKMCIANKAIANNPEVRNKINATRKLRGTCNSSSWETYCYNELTKLFKNVEHHYRSTEYPFECDLYIPELKLYIELNFTWMHQPTFGFYDKTNSKHVEQLLLLKDKAKTSRAYQSAVINWSIKDLAKRDYAKEHNLNWLVFWTLKDFDNWLKGLTHD